MSFEFSLNFAKSMDQKDPLRKYRDQFFIPKGDSGKDKIYFSGNSLGLQPKQTKKYVEQELNDWAAMGSKGHLHAKNPWVTYQKISKKGFASIVGAKEHEVVAMNSLTVNLHLMMVSFYRPTKQRYKILMLKNAFPSDQYAFKSQVRSHGYAEKEAIIQIGPSASEGILSPQDLYATIEKHGPEIAVILLEGVSYLTGQYFDMKKITELGHQQGCVVGFDLAHTTGNIPLQLHDWNVDFAMWCNYKYLNSGPGVVGGCYVHERFSQLKDFPRFEGWWGHDESRRFLMEPDFSPMAGVDAWQLSNVPILSSAALQASLDIFLDAGIENLRKKSIQLTHYLEYLLKEHCTHKPTIVTPSDSSQRGCQLSMAFKTGGKKIFESLLASNAVCDWREPNVIRAAPVPLYNSFEDVYRFVEILNGVSV
jgi:kynureninase